MALTLGNKTYSNPTPGSTSYTIAHNHNTGDDGLLLACFVMSASTTFSGCTYNGTSMTNHLDFFSSSLSQRWAIYSLTSPSTGSNNVVVSFGGNQWNPISIALISWTGSSGVGNVGNNDEASTPHSRTLTVSQNSQIYAFGTSINAQTSGHQIDGSTRPNEFSHNTNRITRGGISLSGLSSGSINVTTTADFGYITNVRVEIKEAAAVASRRIFIM